MQKEEKYTNFSRREHTELARMLAKLRFINNSRGEATNAIKIIIQSTLPFELMIK